MGSKLLGAVFGVFMPFIGPFLGFVVTVSLIEAAMAGVLDSIVLGALTLWLGSFLISGMWSNYWSE